MEWMLDSANLNEVRESLEIFPICGVTTNPTILRSEGRIDYAKHLRELHAIVGANRTFHVQAGVDGCDNIVREAQRIHDILGKDVYIKVPITEEGLKAIARLKAQGVHITATAIYTAYQGLLAADAGVDYLAPYCNRMEQFGIDFGAAISQIRHMIDRDHLPAKILGASYKNVGQLVRSVDCGAHAITAQPAMLRAALQSALVVDAVRTFNDNQAWIDGKD